MTSTTGISNLMMINVAIRNGENVETKHRTQFGSNELIDAMLPVPKNETKMYRIYKTKIYIYEIFNKTDPLQLRLTLINARLKSTSSTCLGLSVSSKRS